MVHTKNFKIKEEYIYLHHSWIRDYDYAVHEIKNTWEPSPPNIANIIAYINHKTFSSKLLKVMYSQGEIPEKSQKE